MGGDCSLGRVRLTRAAKSLILTLDGAEMVAIVDDNGRERRVNDDDRYTLRRYDELGAAADYVSAALATVPTVRRIALFGSIAASPRFEASGRWRGRIHQPKDVDLAVWLDAIPDLNQLRVACGRAVRQLWQEKEAGVAHHQVDVFLLDASGKYLGRLCHFNHCPKYKPQCEAERCGEVPFLQQHDGFVFDAVASLNPNRVRVLYERQ